MGWWSKDVHSMNDLFVHALRDIYYAENEILKALPDMVEKATDPQLKQGFQKHLQETEQQVKRLEQVFSLQNAEIQGIDCPAIDGILEEADATIGDADNKDVMDAGLIFSAQAVEHYEITRYGSLISWARAFGAFRERQSPRTKSRGRNRCRQGAQRHRRKWSQPARGGVISRRQLSSPLRFVAQAKRATNACSKGFSIPSRGALKKEDRMDPFDPRHDAIRKRVLPRGAAVAGMSFVGNALAQSRTDDAPRVPVIAETGRPEPAHPTPQQAWDIRAANVPLKVGWLQPDDISPAAVFLASDAANLVTGAEFEVTAGYSAKDI